MEPSIQADALLARASRGEALAVDQLLSAHLPGLRAFVRLRAGPLVRAKESCSDLVQSVCRELLADLPGLDFRTQAAFKRWLYQAAERKIIDRARYWRAEKRDAGREVRHSRSKSGEAASRLLDCYRSCASPSREIALGEELERVEGAFDRLPQHYREVITLSRLLGLPHAEIAAKLGKSEGAVRTMLCRALAELSEQLY